MKLMQTIIPTLLVLAFLMAPGLTASAQDQSKIGTVDLRKVLNEYYKTKLANADLEQRKSDLAKEVKDMAAGLDKAQTDYKQLLTEASDPAISDQERDRRRQAVNDKSKEITDSKAAYDQFSRTAQTSLQDLVQRMTQKLLAEIQTAVTAKAKDAGYSLVLNTTSDAVVYNKGDNDLTTQVLAQLNAGAPIDLTPAANTNLPATPLLPTSPLSNP
jgi:Skp family chaperone for outer membrane proteins